MPGRTTPGISLSLNNIFFACKVIFKVVIILPQNIRQLKSSIRVIQIINLQSAFYRADEAVAMDCFPSRLPRKMNYLKRGLE